MASSTAQFPPCTQQCSGSWCDLSNNRSCPSLCRLGSAEHVVEYPSAIAVVDVFIQRYGLSAAPPWLPWKLRCEAFKCGSAKVSLIELVHHRRRQLQQDAREKRSLSAGSFDEPLLDSETDTLSRKADIAGAEEISSFNLRLSPGQMVYELEEAKVLLSNYLEEHAATSVSLIVSKATRFLVHLVFLMHWHYHIKYLSRRELTTYEIRTTLKFYLESLGAEQGGRFIDYIVSFPTAIPLRGQNSTPPPQSKLTDPPISIEKPVKKTRMTKLQQLSDVMDLPSLVYLSSLGMTQEQLATLLRRCPEIIQFKVEENIKPVVSFCLCLGVQPSEIPGIVLKRPQLFRCNVTTNLQHKINHLQSLGVETQRFSKILVYFPQVLTYSQSKVSSVFNFLIDIGLSPGEAGEVLARFPHIVGYSISLKLKPVASYLSDLGIDQVSAIIVRSPQTLGLSLEDKIKPVVEFFFSIGFSKEEVVTIVRRFPQLLGLNLSKNLQKKWDFFCQMGFLKSDIVKFPQYFGYDLEKRIIRRYKITVDNNLKWGLNMLLSNSESTFLRCVKTAVLNARQSMKGNEASATKQTANANPRTL